MSFKPSLNKLIIVGMLGIFGALLLAPMTQVFAQAQNLTITPPAITLRPGENASVTISGGNAPYTIQSVTGGLQPSILLSTLSFSAPVTFTGNASITVRDTPPLVVPPLQPRAPQTANIAITVLSGNNPVPGNNGGGTITTGSNPTPSTGGTPSQNAPGATGVLNNELQIPPTDIDINDPCGTVQFGCSLLWWVLKYLYDLTVALAEFAGRLFDFFMWYTMQTFTYLSETFVIVAWGYMRDLANLLLICSLIYAAALLVMGDNRGHKVALHTVVIAFIVNFSLYIAGIPIDASHILARVFYNQITSSAVATEQAYTNQGLEAPKEVSLALLSKIKPQRILAKTSYNPGRDGSGVYAAKEAYFVVMSLSVIINVTLITLFLSIGFMFLGRTIALLFGLIVSPLAFVSVAIPLGKFVNKNEWQSDLIKNAFMLPVFLFFLYLIVLFFNLGTLQLTTLGATMMTSDIEELLGVALPLIFVLVFLNIAKKTAQGMASEVANTVTVFSKKVAGAAAGAVLGGVALGATAVAGPLGAGLVSSAGTLAARGTVPRTTRGGRIAAMAQRAGARVLNRAGTAMQRSSGDVRNTSTTVFGQEISLAALGNAVGVNFGKARTDSYESRAEERRKAQEERIKEMQDLATQKLREEAQARQSEIDRIEARMQEIMNSPEYLNEYERQKEIHEQYIKDEKEAREALNEQIKNEKEILDDLIRSGKDEEAIKDQRAKLRDVEKQYNQKSERITNLEKQTEDGSFFIDPKIDGEHSKLQKEKTQLETDIKKAEEEIANANKTIKQSQKDIEKKTQEIADKKKAIEDELKKAKEEEEDLADQARVAPLNPADLKRQQQLQARIRELEDPQGSALKEIKQIEEENKELKEKITKSQSSKDENEKKINGDSNDPDNPGLKQQLKDKNKDIKEIRGKATLSQLREEKKTMEKQKKRLDSEAKSKRLAIAREELEYIQSGIPVLVRTILASLAGGAVGILGGSLLAGGLIAGATSSLARNTAIANTNGSDLTARRNVLRNSL